MLLHKNIKTCFKRKKTNDIFRDGWDKRDARSFIRSGPSGLLLLLLLTMKLLYWILTAKWFEAYVLWRNKLWKTTQKSIYFFVSGGGGEEGSIIFAFFFQKILNYRFLFGTLFFQTKLVLFLETSNILSLLSTIFDKCISALLYIFRWWIYKSNKRDPVIKVIYSIWPIFLKIYVYYVL